MDGLLRRIKDAENRSRDMNYSSKERKKAAAKAVYLTTEKCKKDTKRTGNYLQEVKK